MPLASAKYTVPAGLVPMVTDLGRDWPCATVLTERVTATRATTKASANIERRMVLLDRDGMRLYSTTASGGRGRHRPRIAYTFVPGECYRPAQSIVDHRDARDLRPSRRQSDHGHRHGSERRVCVPHGVALDHRRHPELREAGRGTRHVARVALPLADPHVLVGPSVGRALPGLRGGHARYRLAHRLAPAHGRRALVHLPPCERMAQAGRSPSDVRLESSGDGGESAIEASWLRPDAGGAAARDLSGAARSDREDRVGRADVAGEGQALRPARRSAPRRRPSRRVAARAARRAGSDDLHGPGAILSAPVRGSAGLGRRPDRSRARLDAGGEPGRASLSAGGAAEPVERAAGRRGAGAPPAEARP